MSVAVALMAAPHSGSALSTSPGESRLHRLVNHSRAANGAAQLSLSGKLSRLAAQHSLRMARKGTLYHSCLSCRFPGSPMVGETVGAGGTVRRVHKMMMASAAHRDVILRSGFDRVGIGVVKRGGWYWVTELFMG